MRQKRPTRMCRMLVLCLWLGLAIHAVTNVPYLMTRLTPRDRLRQRSIAARGSSVNKSMNLNLSRPADTESSHRSWNLSTFLNDFPVMAIPNTESTFRNRFKPHMEIHVPRTCRVAPWEQPHIRYKLKTDTVSYFSSNGSWTCFMEGTSQNNGSHCQCRDNWHGDSCSIPAAVWYSDLNLWKKYKASRIKPRFSNYRRIIQAFPFNIEFDMLDARFAEIGDSVDVFMILESNYTAFGQHKALYLLDSMRRGFYNRTSCKIVHVFLDYFPKKALKDGWVADRLHRDYISSHGLVEQLAGYRDDDVFLLTDADEIPSREVLLFLKLHDGYPEPVGIKYKVNVYGFFWQGTKTVHTLPCAVSVGLLSKVLRLKAYDIRANSLAALKRNLDLKSYRKTQRNRSEIRPWFAGSGSRTAGWHCSWCLGPQGIRNKLVSAQNGDFPRWGSYPRKTKLKYIESLIRNGSWFDDKTFYKEQTSYSAGDVPQHFLDNFDIYKHILVNPFR